MERSPIHLILRNSESVPELFKELFITFSDSSWNDDVDTGRSTGSYLISYMGGIVDHSSNMPDPVALSSAEAEYNEACLACMATKLRLLEISRASAAYLYHGRVAAHRHESSVLIFGKDDDNHHPYQIL